LGRNQNGRYLTGRLHQIGVSPKPLVRVENDPSRLGTLIADKPNGQLWIIGQCCADANHHRVLFSTKTMALLTRLLSGNPAAFARGRSNPTIQGGGKF